MTYTQLGPGAVAVMVVVDLWVLRTRLVTRRVFWTAYAIIVFFQLVTNGMFTGFGIVATDDERDHRQHLADASGRRPSSATDGSRSRPSRTCCSASRWS